MLSRRLQLKAMHLMAKTKGGFSMSISRVIILASLILGLGLSTKSGAQERRPSHCIALAHMAPGLQYLELAGFRDDLSKNTVGLSYVAHASFLIRSPAAISVVTDYTGFLGATDFVPDIATMNRAHETHWTANPDPRIPNVLPGWNPEGGPAGHYLEVGDVLTRSVSTDIRGDGFGSGADGNSIFIFEVAGLCIGHLGHLHHEPSPEQFAAIGRLDVVLAPVDGGMTLPLPVMISVLKRLRASLVIPMHWFGPGTLERFLAGMSDDFAIRRTDASSLEISLRTLPQSPTVWVLTPRYLSNDDH